MKRALTLLSLFFALSLTAQYEIIWSDEFDGTELDLTKWTYDLGGSGWGNAEPQYYTASESNVDVDTGYLRITAIEEDFGGKDYTSARIKTQGLFEVQYGKVEARIKIPKGQGLWPAFWMLGSNIDEVSWPKCGEIDIMEHVNTSFYVHGTYHYDNFGHTYFGESKAVEVEDFQVYAIEWDASKIKWYVNDILYYTANIEDGIGSTEEFHKPFFLLINMATGGYWPGYPDETTVFPADMFVDYVRVYQKNFASLTDINTATDLTIFPNPANEIVKFNGTVAKEISSYSIYDLSGQLITQEDLNTDRSIHTAHLTKGCYILAATDVTGVIRKRFRLMIN